MNLQSKKFWIQKRKLRYPQNLQDGADPSHVYLPEAADRESRALKIQKAPIFIGKFGVT